MGPQTSKPGGELSVFMHDGEILVNLSLCQEVFQGRTCSAQVRSSAVITPKGKRTGA